jgi:hypothetical protein
MVVLALVADPRDGLLVVRNSNIGRFLVLGQVPPWRSFKKELRIGT